MLPHNVTNLTATATKDPLHVPPGAKRKRGDDHTDDMHIQRTSPGDVDERKSITGSEEATQTTRQKRVKMSMAQEAVDLEEY